jgi:hypothetical protein
MKKTKIQLSKPEMELMCNAEIILMKNQVLKKVKSLLEELQQEMLNYQNSNDYLLRDAFTIAPKISKGENYLGLPYLILDYPRRFTPENIFAVRTMFWWGNFFSTTLHLSGSYKNLLLHKAEEVYHYLPKEHFYMGINEDPWQHHFEAENYIRMDALTKEDFEKNCRARAHIKIAAKWPVSEWHFAAYNLWESWKLLLKIVH